MRLVQFDVQADQAAYAAEAGLIHAASSYVQSPRTADDESEGHWGTVVITGKLGQNESTYSVSAFENLTTENRQVEGGPSIPPKTVYFLSEGVSSNLTKRRIGAIFHMGAGTFRAGILAESMVLLDSTLSAYSSSSNLDPSLASLDNQGILTSSRTGFHPDPQFDLTNTTVNGNVYAAAGTSAEAQIQTDDTSVINGATSSLAEPITIEDIQIPKVERAPTDPNSDNEESGEDEPEIGEQHTIMTSPSLQVTWRGNGWEFRHRNFSTTVIGSGGGTHTFTNGQTISVGGDGNVTFEHAGQTHYTKLPGPVAPSTENPPELKSGSYSNVTITEDFTSTFQEGGVFVMKNLTVRDGGKLVLDSDSPVAIYVTGTLDIQGMDAILNTSARPPNLKIYYTGAVPVKIQGGAQAYFTLIAPNADVTLEGPNTGAGPAPTPAPTPSPATGTTSFYGALVGKKVTVTRANFFYDTSTEGIGTGTDSTPFSLISRHRL